MASRGQCITVCAGLGAVCGGSAARVKKELPANSMAPAKGEKREAAMRQLLLKMFADKSGSACDQDFHARGFKWSSAVRTAPGCGRF